MSRISLACRLLVALSGVAAIAATAHASPDLSRIVGEGTQNGYFCTYYVSEGYHHPCACEPGGGVYGCAASDAPWVSIYFCGLNSSYSCTTIDNDDLCGNKIVCSPDCSSPSRTCQAQQNDCTGPNYGCSSQPL